MCPVHHFQVSAFKSQNLVVPGVAATRVRLLALVLCSTSPPSIPHTFPSISLYNKA